MDKEKALIIVEKIKDTTKDIINYAQKSFPEECCGFILNNGVIFPTRNVIDKLKNPALTSKTAFLLDMESWHYVTNRVVGIYHSHPNGDPTMSEADREYLKWNDLVYFIVGIKDHNPTSAKMYWWEKEELCELNINI